MGGAAELPERSSSPLKRPASSMEPEPNQQKDVDVDVDVDMVSVTHTEASPSPSKLEEQGTVDSQDETMAESSSVTTDDTNATWSPGQVEAHIKTIRALTEEMHTAPLEPGQEGFLVSKKWLETVLPDDSSKKTAEVDLEAIGPVDNSDIIWEVIRNPCVGDGVVDDPKKFFVRLKPQYGGEHFEILPSKAWELLRQWPGVKKGQLPIRRVANNTGDEMSSNVVFEFHPVVIPVHRVWSANSPIAIDSSLKATNPPATRLVCEKTSKFQTLLAQAKRFTQIDRAQRVRVWKLPKPPAPAGPDSLTPPASPERQEGTAASDPLGQMLVEVDAFLALERDAERMIVSTDKQSPSTAINDPTTLNALGLTQDEAIVLEEYIPENGWLTQYSPAQASAAMEITQNPARLAAVHPDGTRSGRTSPGPVTRGRARKSGRTLGCVGLHNLGNTCYMNSALQCVRSIEELTKYFLVKEWKKELNKDNVLAHNGEVASQYAHLLEEMYKDPPPGSVSPNKFKNTIGKHAPSFSGYGQQDTQEFLGFLLDGLQEDLSRVKKKPYIEKPDSTDDMVGNHEAIRKMAEQVWDITKKRDDSVIADLFTGMYKSTLVCPDCSKVSITFDPFNTLTLPLPVENKWNHTIKFFPLNDKPIDINVELDKHASIKALKEFISARVGVPADCLFGAEMWKDKFYKIYTDLAAASEEITTNDNAWFFELEAKPTNIGAGAGKQKFGVPVQSMLDTTSARAWKEELSASLLVPVFHRKPGVVRSTYHTNQRWQGCAVPHFIVVTPEEACSEDAIRRKVLEKVASLSTSPIFQDSDTAESTEPEMIGPNGSDSTSSLEGKVAAHSVQGEDDLVDVQMGVPAGENGKAADQSKPSITKHVFNHTRPEWIDPKKFLPVELQNLFEMSYFSENSARVPTGQQSIEDSREYPRLSSRVVVASPTSSEDTAGNDNSTHDAASNEDVSSDETLANTEGPATRMTEESDDDDRAVKTLPQRPKSGRQFKPVAKGPGGGRKKMKAHKTYGKGGKKKLRQQQREEEKHVRAAEPEQDPYEDEPEVTESADGGPLIRLREGIVVEWTEDAFAEVFGSSDTKSTVWDSCETYIDPQLEKTQQTRAKRRKNGISIEQCLDEFERDEILSEQDMWYCPRCKEHRRASKKFDLWKTPDILVMHLKRFSSAGWRRDKLDVFVDYPVENLDITERVLQKEDGKQEVYDLIGVDCHFGGLGGGHYVAHAKSFFDNQWYHYNDSSVSKKSPESVVDTAAYLLFYRRRSDVPLGGPRFQEIFNRFAEATSGDESTEPGEARGLGEGSTLSTGSSSAIRGAGASRQLSGSLGGEQEMRFVLNRNGDDEDEGIDLNDNVLAPKSINGISNWSFARLNEQDNGPSRTPGSPAASDVAQHDSSGDEGSTSAILQGPQIVHEFPDGPDPRAYSGMLSYQLSGDEDFASHADDSPPAYRREPSRDEDMAQIWGEKGGVLEVRPTGESERDSEDVTEIHLDNEDKL